MFWQVSVCAFTLEVRLAIEPHLNKSSKSKKSLMNITKLAQYLHFFTNPQKEITKKVTFEKERLYLKSGM